MLERQREMAEVDGMGELSPRNVMGTHVYSGRQKIRNIANICRLESV